ncbi:hypothetical protein [Microcoleus sp. Pol11C3]|uniref:hypothetical protein n=1 Tax=Microcoleus sp. Pol11C3 TaxID=3055390 RepID=UPI002FCF9361
MFFKRPFRLRGLASTDREPNRFNLYCPLSRIIYAGADEGIYLQVYSPLILSGAPPKSKNSPRTPDRATVKSKTHLPYY